MNKIALLLTGLLFAFIGDASAQTAATGRAVNGCGTPPFTYNPGVSVPFLIDTTTGYACVTFGGGGISIGTVNQGNAGAQSWLFTSPNLELSQATAIAGLKGPMMQAEAVTAIPSFTAGQVNPVTMSTNGVLRMGLYTPQGISTVQNFSTAAGPADAALGVAGIYHLAPLTLADGQETGLQMDSAGNTKVNAPLSPTLSTPQSTLTRPANTTGYTGTAAAPQLIASSTTAGSVVVPTFNILTSLGSAAIPGLTLTSNVTTGWGGVALVVTLYTAAPTYTNGDGGAWSLATNLSKIRAQYACTMSQTANGAWANCTPLAGTAPTIHPDATTVVAWDIQIQSSATPISGQTITATWQVWN